ncbi:MAG TPA: tRNA (cytidine(34)-2'-O)-methyltransferase [Caulobacteraceae bacterium]|nr:tRNA (cytidine(34)-2'-O)-methyltransferase [Caulobacteraceae bacterium]
MRLGLFQPDIPQNLGAAIRLAACLGVSLDVIEPCSFPIDDRTLRRAALDYPPLARIDRHDHWRAFLEHPARREGRLVLFTTLGAVPYVDFAFAPGDTLLFGRESAGAPEEVHARAEARLKIPMVPGARSLNVVNAAAMAMGEALRQTEGFAGAAARG